MSLGRALRYGCTIVNIPHSRYIGGTHSRRNRPPGDGHAHRDRRSRSSAYSTRVEPVFGIIKEQQGARRFLLRGLVNVAAEWTMLATAFNLRTLWRVWRSSPFIGPFNGPEPRPVS